jgi:hypothetical protein
MATYTKLKLSGSTDGKGIKVTQTATAGDTIHTAHATSLIWVYAVNSQSLAVKLTLEWGETNAPDGNIEVTIPGESGLYLVVPGLILTNSSVVKAFAATANVIIIHGFVNRIT